ncbi:hypothetical protein I6F48_00215 [Pseudoalteromonas sp. SWYJ118]|uniref:hypothetical protein n=1 Tax=Pseudoalteromonas sp. SWYJ118 TaxID=2792062 RepID=UPI0018CE948D|nr:hypothetical protein [Pseudoalteromonas sp. SWYJ118]MBH0073987.1 hypothetical protein [Pseudoalteromonas sp. SWYJ118]
MSKGKFSYYSNQYEEALIQELIQELGFNTKTDFFNTVLYGKRISIAFTEPDKAINQEKKFKPNEEQIKGFDKFFNSTYTKADNSIIDLSNCKSLDDYISLIKKIKPTHSQYVNICLEAFKRVLNKFDFDIATPVMSKLSDDTDFMKDINNKVLKAINKEGVRKQKTPMIDDLNAVKLEVDSHQKNNIDNETKRVVKSCLQTIKLIKTINEDNDNPACFNSAIKQIQKTITSISNPKKEYKNFDFLVDKLLTLNIYSYSNTEEQLKIIKPFLENMKVLNDKVRACHSKINDKKSDKNEKIKSVYELRKSLFLILKTQYHLFN